MDDFRDGQVVARPGQDPHLPAMGMPALHGDGIAGAGNRRPADFLRSPDGRWFLRQLSLRPGRTEPAGDGA